MKRRRCASEVVQNPCTRKYSAQNQQMRQRTMDQSIHERLLSLKGMADARSAIQARHMWYFHISPFIAFDGIQKHGLQARYPGGAVPLIIGETYGRYVVCLHPEHTPSVMPAKDGPAFEIAISQIDLPHSLGLDWSYPSNWELASILASLESPSPDEEIFCEVVSRRGSLVTYASILPSALRVRTKKDLITHPIGRCF